MAISGDFSLNYSTKKISHTSGSTRYTVNALYSWLMDLFDDAGQMDDTVPIKANTPTEYELINGWEFNADSDLDYLYGGSIIVNKTGGNDIWANFYTLGTIASGAVDTCDVLLATRWAETTGAEPTLIPARLGGPIVLAIPPRCADRLGDPFWITFVEELVVTGARAP